MDRNRAYEAKLSSLDTIKESNCTHVGQPSILADSRFATILQNAEDIKTTCRDLEDSLRVKLDVMLGMQPQEAEAEDKKSPNPDTWVDKVLCEQQAAQRLLNETFSRLNSF